MANNCLVTKLKGFINNDNLEKLGEIIFPPVRSDFPMNGFAVSFSTPDSLIGHKIILEDIDGNFYGKDYNYTEAQTVYELIPPGHRIKVRNKYDFSNYSLSYQGQPFNKDAVFSLKNFQYSQHLVRIFTINTMFDIDDTVTPLENVTHFSSIYGTGNMKVTDFVRFLPNCQNISFSSNSGKLEGYLKDFGKLTTIYFMQFGECYTLGGSIEDFVREQISHGVTSSDIFASYWKHTQITFNGDRVSQDIDETHLIWEINSSDQTKVNITYGSVTITVPISV